MTPDLEQRLAVGLNRRLRNIGNSPGDLEAVARAGRRLRRRRRAALTGSALVVVSAVAVAAMTLRGQLTRKAEPVSPRVVQPVNCAPHRSTTQLPLPKSGILRSGATQAVLCPINGASWQPPGDALTTGLDHLIGFINSRPPLPASSGFAGGCMGLQPGHDYAITFTYPDGTTSAAWALMCNDDLNTGGATPRKQASAVLNSYAEALVRQRASQTPPATQHAAVCPRVDGNLPQSLLPPRDELDIQQAAVCTYRWTRIGSATFQCIRIGSAALTAHEIDDLNSGFSQNATPIDPNYKVGNKFQTITGVTPWGDNVYLELLDGHLVRSPTPQATKSKSLGWLLPPGTAKKLFGK